MKKTKNIALLAQISLVSFASAATVLDFSTAVAANGSASSISTSAVSPTTFTFVGIGPAGDDFIVSVYNAGTFTSTATTGTITGSNINNHTNVTNGSNEWFFSFSQAIDFTVTMNTNHVNETPTGTNDTQELSIVNILGLSGASDHNFVGGSGQPTVTGDGTASISIGGLTSPASYVTPTPDGAGAPEWTVDANGTGFSHFYQIGNAANQAGQNRFTLCIDETQVVPEPSSIALLGLGGLAFFSRRKRA